jgi:hypothetical protein
LYNGKEKGAYEAGVAFIVDKTIKSSILKFDPINEKICLAPENQILQGGVS